MAKCYVCEEEINKKNETKEHILINAIGGNLKPKTLICKKCNSEFGEKIDAELAKQLNFFSNMLNIKRDRYASQNLELKSKKTGEEILLKPGGKPIRRMIKIDKNLDGNNKGVISISASNMREARKALEGLKRTYGQINVEDTLLNSTKTEHYLNETYSVNFNIGGDKTFRSICKTAINFYMFNEGERKYIEHLIPYIKGVKDIDCVNFYYQNADIVFKNEDEVMHSIIIKSNSKQKLLLAYIELFNCCKFVVLLNDDYDGKDVDSTYYFDILKREQVKKYNNFNISKDVLSKIKGCLEIPTQEILNEFNKVQRIIDKKQYSGQINKFSQQALKNSLSKYPEDVIITSEMIDEFVDELMKPISPFIAHMIKK